MAKESADLRIRSYMVGHKGVTFQSMARNMGLPNADRLYDVVNGKPTPVKILKKVERWLDEHERDHEKIRFT
jgi:hypothetical protein